MYDQAVEADSPAGHRSVGRVVAGSILAITIVLAFLIARRTPEYQAEARLSYVPAAVASPVAGSASPGAGSALPGQDRRWPAASSMMPTCFNSSPDMICILASDCMLPPVNWRPGFAAG